MFRGVADVEVSTQLAHLVMAPFLEGRDRTGHLPRDLRLRDGRSGSHVGVHAERPTSIRSEALIGRWGVASFRQEKDRQRVAAQARAQCKLPYTIARGPTGGVMMHVADDSALYELRPKGGSDGKTYLGLEAPPGHVQDREILSISEREMVMRFVDPDANNRYGTFVYVRCAA